jgi:hypothetical protein
VQVLFTTTKFLIPGEGTTSNPGAGVVHYH